MRRLLITILVMVSFFPAASAFAKISINPPPEVESNFSTRDLKDLRAERDSLLAQFNATQKMIDHQANNCRGVEAGSAKVSECLAEATAVKTAVANYRKALELFKAKLSDEIDATIALLRQPGEIENQKGGRYIDCEATRQFYAQASSSLGSQSDAIERTRAQIDGTKKATQEQRKELKKVLLKGAYDTARDMLWTSGVVRERIGKMKTAGMSLEQRKAWIKAMKSLEILHDRIEKGTETFKAGEQFPEEFSEAEGFKETVTGINALLSESGIYEEGGKMVATGSFGPMGLLAYDAAKLGSDASLRLWEKDVIDEGDLLKAQDTYDNLKYQLGLMQEKLDNAQADLASYCSNGQSVVVSP